MLNKLAVSNIGWEKHDDLTVLARLRQAGVTGVEIAPTKKWEAWQGVSEKTILEYKQQLANEGFKVPAMQAILFGKPELKVFDTNTHAAFIEHFDLVSDIAQGLGAKVLVFGSPKNRFRGNIEFNQALGLAQSLFAKLGDICAAKGVVIGLEHNPVEYGCDFLSNLNDVVSFVNALNHESVVTHIDSAGVHMCGSDIAPVISAVDQHCHYHISEPMLAPVYNGEVDQLAGLSVLHERAYPHWVSIEMKQPENDEMLFKSVDYVSSLLAKLNQ